MSSKPIFVMYGTSGCHLCDEAKDVLHDLHEQMKEQFGVSGSPFFEVRDYDISQEDELIDAYGGRIPVLLSENLSQELAWPFDVQDAYQFMVKVLKV